MSKTDYDDRIKIGSRILSDESMEVLLPNYKNIYNQIIEIRDNAKALREQLSVANGEYGKFGEIAEEEPEFVKHHNNVFSILGERGSGKTSVLLTIKNQLMRGIKELEEKEEGTNSWKNIKKSIQMNDTVLPMVVPQDMDEESDSLGWIIGFFAGIVEKVEKEFQENKNIFKYKNIDCSVCGNVREIRKPDSTNYINLAFEKVKRAYFLRKEDYKKSLGEVGSKKDYVELHVETLSKDIELATCFKKFIDEYIEYQKHNGTNDSKEEALIYIFFDDVDISTRKCLNVLETIIRFLSHSNIVIFVSGNYATFVETIVLNYLNNDKILDSNLIEKDFTIESVKKDRTALKVRKELAYDYLKKVISPALRYELKKLTDEEKVNFKYSSQNEENYKSLIELMEDNFNLTVDSFLRYQSVNKELRGTPITLLFSGFDDKPRGIMNVYYYLNSMSKQIEKNKNIKEVWTESELNHFLNIIIDSSSSLNVYKENIKEVIKIEKDKSGGTSANIDIKYFDIVDGKVKDEEIIEKSSKLAILCLGMLFDGIGYTIENSNIQTKRNDQKGEKYRKIFDTTEENDEIECIRGFLNDKIQSNSENIVKEIIHKTYNPFEMLHIFNVAQSHSLTINEKKKYTYAIEKFLKDMAFHYNKKTTQHDEMDIIEYIKEKVVGENEWLENLIDLFENSSRLLALDVEKKISEVLKWYFQIDNKEIIKQNKAFFNQTDITWANVKIQLNELVSVEGEMFNKYFSIRDEIDGQYFFPIEQNKEILQNQIKVLKAKIEKIEDLFMKNKDALIKLFEENKKQNEIENEIEDDNLLDILDEINASDNNENSLMAKIKDSMQELRRTLIEYVEFGNLKNWILDSLNDYEIDIYGCIDTILVNKRSLNTENFFTAIEENYDNEGDVVITEHIYLGEEVGFDRINAESDLFVLLEELILTEVELYRRNKIMDEIKKLIENKTNKNKENFKSIYRYLGKDEKNAVPELIKEDDKGRVRYDCERIDEYYFTHQMIALLQKNDIKDIELNEGYVNKIARTLKYKDNELKDKSFIEVPSELISKLKEVENQRILPLDGVIKNNIMYVDSYKDILRILRIRVERSIRRHESIDRKINHKAVRLSLLDLQKELRISWRNISESTSSLSIKEKIHFRIYALLFAIIMRESTSKDLYMKKEEFYKNLSKALREYNENLHSDVFQLLD